MSGLRQTDLDALTVPDGEFRLVVPCLHAALYTERDFTTIPAPVLAIYDRYLAGFPPERLRWYATENMTRHKPATARQFNMLRGWLKPGAPPRKEIRIELKDGADDIDTPGCRVEVDGVEAGGYAYGRRTNAIACSFPADPSDSSIASFFDFVADMFDRCPFRWGHAGYALQMSPYRPLDAHLAAWRLSMQHPGVDIVTTNNDYLRVGRAGIKNVNWLTMLGPEFVKLLGGSAALRELLPAEVDVLPVGAGVMIRAVAAPALGHVNRQDRLPAYRAVYKALEPLQRPIVQGFTSFSLPGGDHKEKTTAWLRRFADDHE
jgi:Protein of unknown function (DUF3396)